MIPLYKPFMPDLPEIDKILHSGRLNSGEYTVKFEDRLKHYFDTNYVSVTNSFSNAISVAVTTLGYNHDDEVIVSPMACLVSTQGFAATGLKIIWADIDPTTGTLDPDSVRKRINSRTRFIVHNHFCGYPGYIDEINAIGHEFGIPVIDDGIECFGSTYKEMKIGSCGTDVTIFSFNPIRPLTTIDGGAIIFKSEENYTKSLLIRDCGIDRKRFRNDINEIDPGCDITEQGFSATMSNVNAYIGECQLDTLDQRLRKQRENAKLWDEVIGKYGSFLSLSKAEGEPNYWIYGILTSDKELCIRQFRNLGFYASGVHINNNIYSVFGKQEALLGVEEFFKSFVALPCGWWLERAQIQSL